jgi:hypothetical protein
MLGGAALPPEAITAGCKEVFVPEFNGFFVSMGILGGLLPDAIRFAKGRHKGFPDWASQPGYWVGLLVLLLLGGLAAWLGQPTQWIQAAAMGYAAPEFLSRLFGDDKPTAKGPGGGFPLRKWWAK